MSTTAACAKLSSVLAKSQEATSSKIRFESFQRLEGSSEIFAGTQTTQWVLVELGPSVEEYSIQPAVGPRPGIPGATNLVQIPCMVVSASRQSSKVSI